MRYKDNSSKKRPGRKIKIDKAINVVRLKMNNVEYLKFIKKFEQSGLKTKTDYIKHLLFDKELKVVKVDKGSMEMYMKLTEFYKQYRSVGGNFNQTVKALKANFSEQRVDYFLREQYQQMKILIEITREILSLTQKFEVWLQR